MKGLVALRVNRPQAVLLVNGVDHLLNLLLDLALHGQGVLGIARESEFLELAAVNQRCPRHNPSVERHLDDNVL
eukprot:4979504-Prymnesium_polylepis.1